MGQRPTSTSMITLVIHDLRLAKPGLQNAALRDYDSVRRAIAFISEHWRAQPTIESMADAAGVTPDELHHLFRRWAGLTPKAFMQALTLDHAKGLLRDSASVLDAALDSGLSGPGRRHDTALRISRFPIRHRDRDRQRPRVGRPCVRRSGRRASLASRHAAALAAGHLCRRSRRHRGAGAAYLRHQIMARGSAVARGPDRHRLRGAGMGDAVENPDGPRGVLFGYRGQDQ